MCYVVEEVKYNAASISTVRLCSLICCPLFSIKLLFFPIFVQSAPFYIMVRHTLILNDKKSIINVSQVNVITEVSVIFSFMNLHKPLKMSALISFKMFFRIVLHLLQIVTSRWCVGLSGLWVCLAVTVNTDKKYTDLDTRTEIKCFPTPCTKSWWDFLR